MRKLLENGSARRTIAKNAFWLFAAQGLGRVLRFAMIFLAARALGPEGYGSFSYALAAATLAFMFADWGVGILLMREYGRSGDRERLISAAMGLKAVLIAAFTALGIAGWHLIADPVARDVYLVLIGLMALQHVRDFFLYVFRAQERMEDEFVVTAVEAVGTLGLAALFFAVGGGTVSLGFAYLIAMLASALVAWRLMRRRYAGKLLAWDRGQTLWFLREGWSLALFGVLVMVFFSASQLMLGYVRPPAEVGLYALASKVIVLLLAVPQIVMTSLFPYMARAAGSARGREVALTVTGVLFAIGTAVALAITFLGPLMINVIGGTGFAQAAPVLRNLIWIVPMLFPVTFLDHYLIIHGRQAADLAATAVAALASILLNVALIPAYGISGAVWATLIGQGINTVLTFMLAAQVYLREARGSALDDERG